MIIVANRELIIPKKEQYVGTTYDKNSENRQFLLDRVTAGGVDLANLLFVMDMEYMSGDKNTVQLTKEILDEKIILTWTIQGSELQVTGTIFINLRALNNTDGKVKWASFRAPIYNEDTIYTPGHYTGDLTELEQMEAAFQLDMERNADQYDMIKAAYENGEFEGNGIADITLNDDYTLTITMDDGTVYNTISIRGPQGVSGVFVGPAPLPEGYNVWVDTEGETPAPQDGGYYIPSVSDKGILTWTASDSNMPVVESQNIKGKQGDSLLFRGEYDETKIYVPYDVARYEGRSWVCLKECHEVAPEEGEYWFLMVERGEAGGPASFSIGNVQTLNPTEDAWVTIEGTDDEKVLNFGIPKGSDGAVSTELFYSLFPTDTASGSPAEITDGARNIPVVSMVVNVEPQQSGTGDASPTNVRPLTAKTSLEATQVSNQEGYNENTFSVSNLSNFTSGQWDVVNGVVYPDVVATFDGSTDEQWTATGDGGFKIAIDGSKDSESDPNAAGIVGTGVVGSAIVGQSEVSSRVKVYSNVGTYQESGTDVGTIFLKDNELYYYPPATVTTVAEFQAWLATQNMQVAYPVNEPVEIAVDGYDVNTYYGDNRFSSDDGSVDVEYRCDVQLYIEKKVGA